MIRGNQYKAGARTEKAFCRHMASKGVWLPIRAAGSHGPADVVLVPIEPNLPASTVVCQLKRYTDYPPKPTDEFKSLKVGENVTKWWVCKRKNAPAGLWEITILPWVVSYRDVNVV